VLTHGLPRVPASKAGWRRHPNGVPPLADDLPLHLAVVETMAATVEAAGAVPAIVAVIDGAIRVGLDPDEVARLAADERAVKASSARLASVVVDGGSAGTTVSGTLAACRPLAPRGLRVFATGGIGGVHRGWTSGLDVSADLAAIAGTGMAVISAGAKSLLDLSATAGVLEALGVPILGLGTERLPRFHAPATHGDEPVLPRNDVEAAARTCRAHWELVRGDGGVLVVQPPPAACALDPDEVAEAVDRAERAADDEGARGPARTPFVLGEMTRITGGRTLAVNVALLAANAELGARLATAIAAERAAS